MLSVALLAALAVASPAAAQSPPAEDGPLKAEQFYKNLQVFKGLPAEQVMPAMYFFSSALGVDCGHCHKGEDRISDIPMKNTARRMIQMTASLNNGSFNGATTVTCYTCHRGATRPPAALPADDSAHFPKVASVSPIGSQVGPMPAPAELFSRYAAALGGEAALARLTTMAAGGTATDIDGRPYPLEVLSKANARYVLRKRPTDEIPVSYSGATGWLVDYANHLRKMRLDEVEAAKLEDGVWFPERMAQVMTQSQVSGLEKIGGRDAYVVTGRTAYLPLVQVYFDKDSGLLRRLVYYTDAGIGRFPVQFDVEGYRAVQGVQVPSRWVVTEIRRRRWTYDLQQITPNVTLQDSRFQMPAEHAGTPATTPTAAPTAATPPATPTAPAPTETAATEIPGVVKDGTRVELLKTGLSGTEGPVALPDGSLIFTEREANRITRLDARGQFSTYLSNPNGTNSLSFDPKGRLLAVQWVKPRVVALQGDSETVIADAFDGRPFGRPNDLTADAAGGVYFTDPGAVAPNKRAVFYVTPAGAVRLVSEDVEFPNGVALSPDEKTLYVANTAGEHVIAFDRRADGTVANMRNFARLTGPARTDGVAGVRSGADGLAVDGAGRLYVATTAGVQVFSAKGEALGTIPIGLANGPQNLAFAGPEKKTLYVIGRGAMYRIAMVAEGYKGRAK